MKLWYKSPATDWIEGLPIGTGRLAATVMGTYKRERIALNHEWLWKGLNRDRDNEVRSHLLPDVRRLLLDGRFEEGTIAANDAFGLGATMEVHYDRVDPFQPAGDLYLEFNHACINDYVRDLNLSSAVASVSYGVNVGSARLVREYVAHLVEDLILVRVTQEGQPFDCVVWLDRMYDRECDLEFETVEGCLTMKGQIQGGTEFQVNTYVSFVGGSAHVIDTRKLLLRGVTELVLSTNIGVTANHKIAAEECLQRVPIEPAAWPDLMRAHIEEHGRHFGSMALEVDVEDVSEPTDQRLRNVRNGKVDPGLALLYFHYGRYLLSASSANATLPANLQGKWNEDIKPPWNADYHHDVNLQMNYWMAEPVGMQRYVEALLQHIERFVPHARKAARDLYGCRGVYFPIQTDPWGRATPESYGWAVWIGAAPWLAQHLWWHYEFSQNTDFLKDRAYPFFKEVVAFFEDYLVKDESGIWQIVPSQSPENRFVGTGILPVSIGVSATMDVILVREALRYAVESSKMLAVDVEDRERWQGILDAMPELKIGQHGQLQEWNEDFEEAEPGHRHVSHLIGLYPGDMLDRERTPDLWRAAEIALDRRMAVQGDHFGWSHAWAGCLYARLGRAEDAWKHLVHLISELSSNSLLDLARPRMFQIDGNFGGAAAVIEMLLQSYREEIHFLPALPEAWSRGRAAGIRARGGIIVGMEWKGGALVQATLRRAAKGEGVIVHALDSWIIRDSQGRPASLERNGSRLCFEMAAGETYQLSANS